MDVSLTTNGVLVDEEWAALLGYLQVSITVSLDGPASVHDRVRPDLLGNPTHARALAGLDWLRGTGVRVGLLAVCDPSSDPGD